MKPGETSTPFYLLSEAEKKQGAEELKQAIQDGLVPANTTLEQCWYTPAPAAPRGWDKAETETPQ